MEGDGIHGILWWYVVRYVDTQWYKCHFESKNRAGLSLFIFSYDQNAYLHDLFTQSMILMTLQKSLDLSSICSFGCEGLEIKKEFFYFFCKDFVIYLFISLYFLVIQPDLLQ
jgi:hypothetical protein